MSYGRSDVNKRILDSWNFNRNFNLMNGQVISILDWDVVGQNDFRYIFFNRAGKKKPVIKDYESGLVKGLFWDFDIHNNSKFHVESYL